jgi:hypothetical protein
MRAVHAAPDTLWALLTGQARGPSLQPGDELVLEGAEFDMPVKLRVPGLSLRSAEPRAPATLKQTLSLSADGTRASDVRVVGSTERSAVTISGRDCVLSRFEVTGHQRQGMEVTGRARNPLVELGWIHGQVPGAEAGTPRANLIFGSDKQTSDEAIGGVARYILIETTSSNRNAAEIKATSVRYENIVAPGGRVYTRHGLRNQLVSCMARLLLANEDAALVGCVADGADGLVGIKAGGITGDELRRGQKGYPIGVDALLVACEGLHVVGFTQGDGPAWSKPPHGSRVYRPQGRVEARLGATYATLADLPDGIALPARQAVRLTSAMVGVNGSGIGDAEPTAPGTPLTPATILASLEKALADTADLAGWIKAIRAAQAEQRKIAEKTALKGASMLRRAAASAAEGLRAEGAG